MFRRKESKQDALFVRNLAKRLNLPVTIRKEDVPEEAKSKKISSEEAARFARYSFLLKVAKEVGARKIAVGHTKDDQAETVLMRLIRGAGLSGLNGIPPTRKLDGCVIVRPLIEIWRSDLEEFLKENNIATRRDSSNSRLIYLRNKLRHKLIPLLQKYNPNIKEVLADTAGNLTLDYQFLRNESQKALEKSKIQKSKFKIIISLKKLLKYHRAVQRMIVRLAIEKIKQDTRRLTYQHWRELEDLIDNRHGGSIVDLPKSISVLKKQNRLIFYLRVVT
jgi:tRNA(Ile)-lysidine synthase